MEGTIRALQLELSRVGHVDECALLRYQNGLLQRVLLDKSTFQSARASASASACLNLLCFALPCFNLPCSVLLCSALICFTLLSLACFCLLCSALICCVLLTNRSGRYRLRRRDRTARNGLLACANPGHHHKRYH